MPARLIGPPADSESFDFFTAQINGEQGSAREDYLAVEDAGAFAERVAKEPGALGYFSVAELEEADDRLSILGIDAGAGCVRRAGRPSSRAATGHCRVRSTCT
ncbi:MAG: hypothetical protein M3133_06870 [Actinomycetota bacterium]|nr:hypothetical protein [Actinomycetota bacterium]